MLESLNYSFRNPKNITWVICRIKQLRNYKKNHGVLRGPQLDKQRWQARLGILRVKIKSLSILLSWPSERSSVRRYYLWKWSTILPYSWEIWGSHSGTAEDSRHRGMWCCVSGFGVRRRFDGTCCLYPIRSDSWCKNNIPYLDLKLTFLKGKCSWMLWFYVNTVVSHNVRTHWMYRPMVNTGLKMVC